MSPFEIPQAADITKFVEGAKESRTAMDELAKAAAKMGKDGGKTEKSAKSVGSFIEQLRKAAPQLALTAAVAPTIMQFLSGLTEPFSQVGEAVEELGFTASEGFEVMATDIADSIYELEPIAQSIGDFIGDTYDKVQAKDWDGLSTNVETGLTDAWDGIVDFFDDDELMTDIGTGAASVINGIADFLKMSPMRIGLRSSMASSKGLKPLWKVWTGKMSLEVFPISFIRLDGLS